MRLANYNCRQKHTINLAVIEIIASADRIRAEDSQGGSVRQQSYGLIFREYTRHNPHRLLSKGNNNPCQKVYQLTGSIPRHDGESGSIRPRTKSSPRVKIIQN